MEKTPNTQGASWERDCEMRIHLLSQAMRRYMFVEAQEQSSASSMESVTRELEGQYEHLKEFIREIASEERAEGERRGAERAVKYITEHSIQESMYGSVGEGEDGRFFYRVRPSVIKEARALPADSTEDTTNQ